ncbi:hypothetical protein [Parashewanella tropica]|uniref:hypothetical protein n=1 Tax=Parashewanella tropica TaxID=2547970 RepID=UPI00105A9DFF|nr:hypothetical protein [Parashewanella tropica]
MKTLTTLLATAALGFFSATASASNIEATKIDTAQLHQDIKIDLTLSMSGLFNNLMDTQSSDFLVAKNEEKPQAEEASASEE